jgi:hypothetical protein
MSRPTHGEPTGATRYRVNWRGKLILQIGVWDSWWCGEVRWVTKWRDAHASDFLPEHRP